MSFPPGAQSNRRYRPGHIAKGHAWAGDSRKVVILLDEETFAEVRERALAAESSFAAQARMLIEVGLEELKRAGQ